LGQWVTVTRLTHGLLKSTYENAEIVFIRNHKYIGKEFSRIKVRGFETEVISTTLSTHWKVIKKVDVPLP
jgi:uncharacterized sporulation protein YeaH/YhbH (DUF444 family)